MSRIMLFAMALTVALAQAATATVVVQNGSFEDPSLVAEGGHIYTAPFGGTGDAGGTLTDVPGWTFSTSESGHWAGLAGGTTFGDTIVNDPVTGPQVAFLQGGGWVSQALTGFIDGTFSVGFNAKQDAAYVGNSIVVALDGVSIGTVTPAAGAVGAALTHYTTTPINVLAGSHVLSFTGTAVGDAFPITYLDNVSVSGTSTVPEPGACVLLGTGLIGLLAYAWRRRK